jgi:hypothetical protein
MRTYGITMEDGSEDGSIRVNFRTRENKDEDHHIIASKEVDFDEVHDIINEKMINADPMDFIQDLYKEWPGLACTTSSLTNNGMLDSPASLVILALVLNGTMEAWQKEADVDRWRMDDLASDFMIMTEKKYLFKNPATLLAGIISN